MVPPEEEREGGMEPPEEAAPEKEGDTTPVQPRPELRIVDYSEKKVNQYCTVCRRERDHYIEIEIDGVIEYTCRDCYERPKRKAPVVPCKKCGTLMEIGDNFCGKCGTPAILKCSSCDAEIDEEDRFCAKCGARLFSED